MFFSYYNLPQQTIFNFDVSCPIVLSVLTNITSTWCLMVYEEQLFRILIFHKLCNGAIHECNYSHCKTDPSSMFSKLFTKLTILLQASSSYSLPRMATFLVSITQNILAKTMNNKLKVEAN
jgi:hypothetical protein